VSHLKERKDPTCLNCQTSPLYGRFCHICGQENLEPKETVWHLVQHFFNDITHFDGKFFSTVKYLLKKPGFLSSEYVKGRRASYLNPIRMYVFTSAIFFIILFSLKSSRKVVQFNETPGKEETKGMPDLVRQRARIEANLAKAGPDEREDIQQELGRLNTAMAVIKKKYGDTTTRQFGKREIRSFWVEAFTDSLQQAGVPSFVKDNIRHAMQAAAADTANVTSLMGWTAGNYKSEQQYDSVQAAAPDSLRDGWFKRLIMRRLIVIDEEYHHDKKSYQDHLVDNFLHSFPKIMFFSLPFFALILRLLYVRRKQYLYVEHGIFTIHLYCATFLATLVLILVKELRDSLNFGWLNTVSGILIFLLVLYMFIYLYKAMRVFYGQRRFKTIVKYFILCLLAFIVNTILMVLFLLISAISV
jgi:hypothetical protein